MREKVYYTISAIFFGAFIVYVFKYAMPHIPLLMFAMFFALMGRTER